MATNLGLASLYNVFVFGNLSLSNTDAEGRVAVGGNATLSSYGIGANISPLPPANTDASFVVNGNIDVTGGSNASGNTVISPTSTIINHTMGNPNGSLIVGTPIDFVEAERYLKCASGYWDTLESNGTGEVVFGQLNLTGTNETLNIFEFDSANIYGSGLALNQLNGINIIAPLNATILINVRGTTIAYGSYQIFRNGTAATREQARKIMWNYPEALTWTNSTTAIYGSVLAPFATANTTFSQINGNIVFDTYLGNAESHNELFIGELPEPTVCLLTTTSTTDSTTTASTTTDSTTTASTTTDSTTTVSTTTASTTTTRTTTDSTTTASTTTDSTTTASTTTDSTTTASTTTDSTTTASTTTDSTTTASTTTDSTTTASTTTDSTTTVSTTTTTTTTTSTTTTTTTTTIDARCQAISDLLESVALQQTALSHILNAEGEKLQKILSFDDISHETVLSTNKSVESMVNAISNLEVILKDKIDLFGDCICDCPKQQQ